MSKTNYVFVDLDETLIFAERSAYWPDGLQGSTLVWRDKSSHNAVMRPGALEFLAELRAFPNTIVFMLTAADTEYANGWNKLFGFGFEWMTMFCAEDMKGACGLSPVAFPNAGRVVLFDNLPEFEHRRGKIPFIGSINNKVIYVRVPEYYGHPKDALTEELRAQLIAKGLEKSL